MDLPEKILSVLEKEESVKSLEIAKQWDVDHQKLVGAIKSLESLGDVVKTVIETVTRWELTGEGKVVASRGSHEASVYNAVPKGDAGVGQPELMSAVGAEIGKVGMGKALSRGWIVMDKSSGKPVVKRKVGSITDTVGDHMKAIAAGRDGDVAAKDKAEYKKRKLLQEVTIKAYTVSRGAAFTTNIEKAETELTPDMISSGAWKTAKFKPYNFNALGIQPAAGHLHPLLKVRAEYRQIFLEMGFTEMPTNNFVESSFWNFDALFQPQQHPARDAHDTFFISNPSEASDFPKEYLEKVKKVHSEGGFGSQGYGYDWKIGEAKKNLLRTHTTAVSARMLYKLAQDGFKPQKYFSIDRVFRNETLDATHLAEFHQIEGVIADYGLTLSDLIGVLYQFFKKLGVDKLRFKPAYNPYTEPSMEIFSYHEGLGKWLEIGNSGIFRPEMLLPMGIPEGVNVIAWGLSLERPTMIKCGLDNIRDLCGNRVNLKMVQENPICRLDKDTRDVRATLLKVTENRWDAIALKVDSLAKKVSDLQKKLGDTTLKKTASASAPAKSKRNLVISANPSRPPYSVLACIQALAKAGNSVWAKTHAHSSLSAKDFAPPNFLSCNEDRSRSDCDYTVSLIWRGDAREPSMSAGAASAVEGEDNILRYFSRIASSSSSPRPGPLPYEAGLSAAQSALVDSKMDAIAKFSVEKVTLEGEWVCGSFFSIADVLLYSTLTRNRAANQISKKWEKAMTKAYDFKSC